MSQINESLLDRSVQMKDILVHIRETLGDEAAVMWDAAGIVIPDTYPKQWIKEMGERSQITDLAKTNHRAYAVCISGRYIAAWLPSQSKWVQRKLPAPGMLPDEDFYNRNETVDAFTARINGILDNKSR